MAAPGRPVPAGGPGGDPAIHSCSSRLTGFVGAFVAARNKVMTLDRFDLA